MIIISTLSVNNIEKVPLIYKNLMYTQINLASLSPTQGADKQNSLRAFLRMNFWLGWWIPLIGFQTWDTSGHNDWSSSTIGTLNTSVQKVAKQVVVVGRAARNLQSSVCAKGFSSINTAEKNQRTSHNAQVDNIDEEVF